jgi:hypothetical protein
MKIQTNFSNSGPSGTSFEPIPSAVYDARIFGMDYNRASTGTPCLNIEFEIEGPTHEGRHIWGNIYLTEKASWKYQSLCNAVGITPSEELETRDILSKKLRIVVKQTEGLDGNPRSEAVGFRKPKSETAPF